VISNPFWNGAPKGLINRFRVGRGLRLDRDKVLSTTQPEQPSGQPYIPVNAVDNTNLADMPAWSIKLRNDAAAGDPHDAALADLTAEAAPAAGDFLLGFLADGSIVKIDVGDLAGVGAYTDEEAQDAVGLILTDSATIDFTYNDGGPSITAGVKAASITEAMQVLADNTTHDASTSMHGYMKKLPGGTSTFFRADGSFATVAGSGALAVLASYEYTANDTWTINAATKLVYVEVIGGGGSAGSGAAGTNGAQRQGGGGGSAGAVTCGWFLSTAFSGGVTVTVGGAQATVGTGVTGTTPGNPGADGNASSFGAFLAAIGGRAGTGGTAGGSGGGTVRSGTSVAFDRLNGSLSTEFRPGSGSGNGGRPGSNGARGGHPELFSGPGGGAQGAGVDTTGTVSAGNLGGAGHGAAGGGMFQQSSSTEGGGGGTVGPVSSATAAIAASNTAFPWFGDGGPSGGSSTTTNGGAGASGAAPGGGGGGGGGCRNANTSGAGGAGARGAVRVIELG